MRACAIAPAYRKPTQDARLVETTERIVWFRFIPIEELELALQFDGAGWYRILVQQCRSTEGLLFFFLLNYFLLVALARVERQKNKGTAEKGRREASKQWGSSPPCPVRCGAVHT